MGNSKLTNLTNLIETFNAQKKVVQDQAKSLFLEASKELFDEFPELVSFGWEQYAPYFNDGDPCHFSVYADYPTINGYDTGCDRFVDSDEETEPTAAMESLFKNVKTPIAKLINTLPYDIMQQVFGDDLRVTITREGKVVDGETNHD